MSALTHFHSSIRAADELVAMYLELRRSRGLGQRGRLDAENLDLLSLPRSAVVASLSALDAYVHAVVYERIPVALGASPVPEPLCDLMASTMPIKNAASFRDALPVLAAQNSLLELCDRVKERTLSFLSFQAPEKVSSAYQPIGFDGIFESVSAIWPGPKTKAEDLKRNLATFARRRNQIAHEGDHDAVGQPRPMQPQYAQTCRDFVSGLVARLNRVVYGV